MITNIPGADTPAATRRLILIMTALAPLLVWGTHPAQAQLACGGEIMPGDNISLGDNIGPCDEDPALTITGAASFNLNGFTISCGAAMTGIQVLGARARILNGEVKDCEYGIVVDGEGRHRLLKLTATSTQDQVGDRGFWVRSDYNTLTDNLADAFNGEGFRIEGVNNRVTENRATGNTNEGFRISGDHNDILKNWAADNFNHGFRVGGNNNRLVDNHAEDNKGGEGFRLDGNENRIVNNIAINNNDEGFRIRDGQDNTLVYNRAEGNGVSDGEAGIRIQGDGNRLRLNDVIDNFGDGILVTEGADKNTITENVATGNDGTDLVDENLDCAGNLWSENQFGTKSQDCIE